MACKKSSRLIKANKRRKSIKVVIISYENRISNTAEYSRPYKDSYLIYTIEIIIDCEFLIICEYFIMSSVFRLGGNTIEAISKLFFINLKISGCTRDIRLLETLKSIVGLANSSLFISVRFGHRVVE
jgi:hypothetical protein